MSYTSWVSLPNSVLCRKKLRHIVNIGFVGSHVGSENRDVVGNTGPRGLGNRSFVPSNGFCSPSANILPQIPATKTVEIYFSGYFVNEEGDGCRVPPRDRFCAMYAVAVSSIGSLCGLGVKAISPLRSSALQRLFRTYRGSTEGRNPRKDADHFAFSASST